MPEIPLLGKCLPGLPNTMSDAAQALRDRAQVLCALQSLVDTKVCVLGEENGSILLGSSRNTFKENVF